MGQARYWAENIRQFCGRSTHEKNFLLFGKIYSFSRYCRKLLPERASVKFSTDLDLSRDPGMIIHRILAYYLYPVDLRNIRREKAAYLIAFQKKNAKDHIPPDYTILTQLDDQTLIAVLKND